MNQRLFKQIALAVPIVTVLILSGIFVDLNDVLFNTGLKPLHLAIIGNGFLAWAIWKNRI